ncbi:MAG: YdcF family protein, partial [bacterium]|nr:YdcF family protein [bacterium]
MEKRVNRALKEFYSSPNEYVYDSVRSIPTKMLLFSGGSSDGISKPEGAIMMNDFALSKGVDKKFMTIEDKSRTTVENLINCKMILDRNYRKRECFSSGCLPKLTICTSTFHIRRVIVLAK